MSASAPIITLLTDFGTADYYVGAVKGVICRIAGNVRLIDVCHEIPPQGIISGAFVLNNVISWFPAETIHLAVVDPGVGSRRRIIAGRWDDQIVVAPDNGLVSLVHEQRRLQEIYEVTNRDYFLEPVSPTFHGRDIMAPTAAHLAAGCALSTVGAAIESPLTLHISRPQQDKDALVGYVVHVDHFGNLISNIGERELDNFLPAAVHIRKHVIALIGRTYEDVPEGQPIALIGSSGMLEISINQGHAAAHFGAEPGDRIVLTRQK